MLSIILAAKEYNQTSKHRVNITRNPVHPRTGQSMLISVSIFGRNRFSSPLSSVPTQGRIQGFLRGWVSTIILVFKGEKRSTKMRYFYLFLKQHYLTKGGRGVPNPGDPSGSATATRLFR